MFGTLFVRDPIVYSPVVAVRVGSYLVILALFCVRIALSLLVCLAGRQSLTLLAVFFVLNRYPIVICVFSDSYLRCSVIGEGTFSFFNLSVSDIVDEDAVEHKRDHNMGAMIFGMHCLKSWEVSAALK